jgi:c(7)-type cytochrome triheme protein
MRAAIAVALLVGVSAVAQADSRQQPVGFDHGVHERDLYAGGKDPLPCARCHVVKAGKLVGRPDHAACFGACHGPRPTTAKVPADREKLCVACHAEAALAAGNTAVSYPPYVIDRDFGLVLGHKQHAAVACTQCHADPERKVRGIPHARCAGCHDGTAGHGPPMTDCARCHPPAIGTPVPPELAAVHNTVTATFSHKSHAARGGAGADCNTCHAAIRQTDDTELPRPTTAACATCHDGKAAFAVTAACTRCHTRPPDTRFDVIRPADRFTHGGNHAAVIAATPCASCHPLTSQGEVVVGGHASCAQCHAADFGARSPKICGACHNATEPWRHLVADRGPAQTTEFGATLDHGKHPAACQSCHSLRTTAAQLRPPRGHAACRGNGCHATASGPAPKLSECTSCHALGRAAGRLAQRIAAAWSVRARFDHGAHEKTACMTCHIDLSAPSIETLATPPKATCATCHDGKTSFKVTGTGCARCHGGGS